MVTPYKDLSRSMGPGFKTGRQDGFAAQDNKEASPEPVNGASVKVRLTNEEERWLLRMQAKNAMEDRNWKVAQPYDEGRVSRQVSPHASCLLFLRIFGLLIAEPQIILAHTYI